MTLLPPPVVSYRSRNEKPPITIVELFTGKPAKVPLIASIVSSLSIGSYVVLPAGVKPEISVGTSVAPLSVTVPVTTVWS